MTDSDSLFSDYEHEPSVREEEELWKSGGEYLSVDSMTTDHITNTLKALEERRIFKSVKSRAQRIKWIHIFREELAFRKYDQDVRVIGNRMLFARYIEPIK